MKLVGTIQKVKVENISEGIVTRGRFALQYKESKTIETIRYPEDILKAIENYHALGYVLLESVEDVDKSKSKAKSNVVKVETQKNEAEKHEHTVYDPEKAKRDRLINVEPIEDNSNAVDVGFTDADKADATDFLAKHWKTIEKDLESIKSKKKLEFLKSIAEEIGMHGNKKHELIEDRIANLK